MSLLELPTAVAWFRYALVLAVLALAALAWRRPGGQAALGAIVAGGLVWAFWTAALGRPYGLLVEGATTRRVAAAVVAAHSGHRELVPGQVGTPWEMRAWAVAGGAGLPASVLPWLPPALALLGHLASAAAVLLAWRPRPPAGGDARAIATVLWVFFAAAPMPMLAGWDFVGGLWARPELAPGFAASVALVLLAAARGGLLPALAACGLATLAASAAGGPGTGGTILARVVALTLDQGPWLPIAALGMRLRRDPAAVALAVAGGASALAFPDPWPGLGLYRLGLLLGAVPLLLEAGQGLWPAQPALAARRVLALTLAAATGSAFVWWDPVRIDRVAEASAPAIAVRLEEAMREVRARTPPHAVVMASPAYAPAVLVLAGRRVLRVPALLRQPDESRRGRLERFVVAGREAGELRSAYGLTHVFVAPGDYRDLGLAAPEDLVGRGGLRVLYADAEGFRLLELPRGAGADGGASE